LLHSSKSFANKTSLGDLKPAINLKDFTFSGLLYTNCIIPLTGAKALPPTTITKSLPTYSFKSNPFP
jgi:hypothetical protein